MAAGSAREVELVVAVEVDVLTRERRDFLGLVRGDQLPVGAKLIENVLGVDRVPLALHTIENRSPSSS